MSKTIEIKIPYYEKRKKLEAVFDIHITPNRFTVDYGAYMKRTAEILDINAKYETAETKEELESISANLENMDLETILDEKYNLIKTMLKANGHDYDREFWDMKADPNDVNRFISECAAKDQSEDAKKKVLAALLVTMKG